MKDYLFDVSIIFVNYNTADLLVQAIQSVYEKSSGFSYEIIVVDNNSKENPQQTLKTLFDEKITFLGMSENLGFGRANNEGIKIAQGRNIFLLNTDTYLVNNAIYVLLDYIDSHPEVGSCGGTLLSSDMKPTYSYHKIPYGIWSYELSVLTLGLSRRLVKHAFYNTTDKPLCVGNVSGANMMISRKVLDEVGFFDPIFFMYCEESELSWRIRKAGYKNVNVPQALIVHLEGKSSKIKEQRKMMELDGRRKYYVKTHGRLYFELANVMLVSGLSLRQFFYWLMGRKSDVRECLLLKNLIYKAYYEK